MNEFDKYDEPSMRTMRGDTNEGILGRIDQYEIIRKLGGGGFGVVYLVRDTQSDVEYAIKTLHPLLKSNLEEMENLRSQFKLVSKLIHSHIAPAMILHPVKEVVYVTEEVRKELRLSSGDFVMVMKYAPGVTLSNWRKQFPNKVVPVDKAIDICKQIASALDYAHAEKIIHRDIKPGNIMIETRGDEAIARVLDFGLAAEIRSSMSRVSTDKGDTSGTRPYMAPEQWQGEHQGSATDQYALACLFYELVSGGVPFAGAFETGDAFIMLNAVENRVPSALDVLSKEQNLALQKALAKNQKDRFVLCLDFINALNGEKLQQITNDVSQPQPNSSKKVKCKKCGTENFVTTKFCPECGAKVERDDICLQCGVELEPNQKFCKICGAKTPILVAQEQAEQERKAREELEHKNRNEAEKKEADEITKNNPQPISEIIGNMVRIPDNAKHKGLYFSKYQVTQAQWQAVMGDNPSDFRGDLTRPVERVSWYDCQEFIKKLNALPSVKESGLVFRLPTWEEWEYACRAGSKGKYGLLANGRQGTLGEMGWYAYNSGEETHPVGQKRPNAWGLYDMHGNVWEWTSSRSLFGRIYRGGCWCSNAKGCESGNRSYGSPGNGDGNLGFRLAASRTEK